jgi:hypothetical protein
MLLSGVLEDGRDPLGGWARAAPGWTFRSVDRRDRDARPWESRFAARSSPEPLVFHRLAAFQNSCCPAAPAALRTSAAAAAFLQRGADGVGGSPSWRGTGLRGAQSPGCPPLQVARLAMATWPGKRPRLDAYTSIPPVVIASQHRAPRGGESSRAWSGLMDPRLANSCPRRAGARGRRPSIPNASGQARRAARLGTNPGWPPRLRGTDPACR